MDMSSQEYILLEANDCCPLRTRMVILEAIQHFVLTSTLNVLHFRTLIPRRAIAVLYI